jgi:hypothetical protein
MRFSILIILLGMVGCASSPAPTAPPTQTPEPIDGPVVSAPTPTPTPTPEPPPAPPWEPTGEGWRSQRADTGQVVWFRFVRGEGCPGGARFCLNSEVTTEEGCSSLYVQASLVNEAGQNVGWTNDTLQGLQPKEVGRISLRATERGTFRLDEVNCR